MKNIKTFLPWIGSFAIMIGFMVFATTPMPAYKVALNRCISKATEDYATIYRDIAELKNLSYAEIEANDSRYLEQKSQCYLQYYPAFKNVSVVDHEYTTKYLDPFYETVLIRAFEFSSPDIKIKFAPRVFKSENIVQ